jgi:hypothetical protein
VITLDEQQALVYSYVAVPPDLTYFAVLIVQYLGRNCFHPSLSSLGITVLNIFA